MGFRSGCAGKVDRLGGYDETALRRLVLYLARKANQSIAEVEAMRVDDFVAYIEAQDSIEDEIRQAYEAELEKIKANNK